MVSRHMPPELFVFLLALLPLTEVRVAIPAGIFVWGLHPLYAIAIAFLGSLTVIAVVAPALWKLGNWLTKHPLLSKIVLPIFERTHSQHKKRFEHLKDLALFIFVLLPLPLSGVWSGILAGFVFGFSLKKTMALCALGALGSALIVGILSVGVWGL